MDRQRAHRLAVEPEKHAGGDVLRQHKQFRQRRQRRPGACEAGYNSTVSEQDLRLTDIFTLSPTLLHETHIGFTWKNTTNVPLSTTPSLQVAGAFTGGGATAGHLQNRERDLEVDDDVMWSHHKHQVKIGVASLGILVHDYDPDTFNGAFVFGGGLAPALDNSGQQTAISGLEQYRRTLLALPVEFPPPTTSPRERRWCPSPNGVWPCSRRTSGA